METTLIPESIIIKLVTSLQMNHFHLYSEFFLFENEKTLMTIFSFEKYSTNFIITATKLNTIRFFSVQYTTSELTSSILNVIQPIPVTTIRGNVKMSVRGSLYSIEMKVPSIQKTDIVKESILTLFTFPSQTFLLNGTHILHFTKFCSFFYITYIGLYNNVGIESIVYWDYGNDTLIGKVKDQVYYIFNSSKFDYCNQYGDIRNNGNIIIGGTYDYLIDENNENVKSITYAYCQSFQANEINGSTIRFCSFEKFVPVKNTIYYFIAIANTLQNSFPNYAVFSQSNFRGTKSTIQTFPVCIQFVTQKDDTFQNSGTLYFRYINNVVEIYEVGYVEFLNENVNNFEIMTTTTYEKDFSKNFNVLTNSFQNPTDFIVYEDQEMEDTNYYVETNNMVDYFSQDYQK